MPQKLNFSKVSILSFTRKPKQDELQLDEERRAAMSAEADSLYE